VGEKLSRRHTRREVCVRMRLYVGNTISPNKVVMF
jgi:hypothetical protein